MISNGCVNILICLVLISEIKIVRIFINNCTLISTFSTQMDGIDNYSSKWEHVRNGIESQILFHIELQRHLSAVNSTYSHK